MKSTEQIITEMLTESTGKALMDSGDAYGRHWEDNQKNGIKTGQQPVDFYINKDNQTCAITPNVAIFDYLKESLEYTEECQMLESLLPHLNYDALYNIESIVNNPSNYPKELQLFERNEYFGSNVYNTYNDEDCLTQGFQYIWFTYDADDYIAISIHNGCDIRGGYTDIHIFKVEWSEEFTMARCEAFIDCECGMHKYQQLDPIYMVYNNGYDEEVNEKFIYAHSYKDNNGDLRCKYCNHIISSSAISI